MNKKYKSKKAKVNRDCSVMKIFSTTFDSILNIIIFIPCCLVRREFKKKKLRESGYIVDPPIDYFFNPRDYSVITNNHTTIYQKYGKTYTSYKDIPKS